MVLQQECPADRDSNQLAGRIIKYGRPHAHSTLRPQERLLLLLTNHKPTPVEGRGIFSVPAVDVLFPGGREEVCEVGLRSHIVLLCDVTICLVWTVLFRDKVMARKLSIAIDGIYSRTSMTNPALAEKRAREERGTVVRICRPLQPTLHYTPLACSLPGVSPHRHIQCKGIQPRYEVSLTEIQSLVRSYCHRT